MQVVVVNVVLNIPVSCVCVRVYRCLCVTCFTRVYVYFACFGIKVLTLHFKILISKSFHAIVV